MSRKPRGEDRLAVYIYRLALDGVSFSATVPNVVLTMPHRHHGRMEREEFLKLCQSIEVTLVGKRVFISDARDTRGYFGCYVGDAEWKEYVAFIRQETFRANQMKMRPYITATSPGHGTKPVAIMSPPQSVRSVKPVRRIRISV